MQNQSRVKLFYSYSHKDKEFRDQLETHLTVLQRQNVIQAWDDRKIVAGEEWGKAIDENLEAADIILLLISSDFLASDYCHDVEVERAMKKHEEKSAVVIPILLRVCSYQGFDFMKLQGLPENFKAVKTWDDRDEAFTNIVQGIRKVAEPIQSMKKANGETVSQSKIKFGEEFKNFLHEKISEQLQRPEALCLRKQLIKHLKLDSPKSDHSVKLIADKLLSYPIDEAIRNFLTEATKDCTHSMGESRQEVGDKVDLVKDIAEQILGWMVSNSIHEEEFKNFLLSSQREMFFFNLAEAVGMLSGVEIVLSRYFNRKADLKVKDKSEPRSSYCINMPNFDPKYSQDENVRKILIEIWNIVFNDLDSQKGSNDILSESDIQFLDETLRSRRMKLRDTEHYYIAFKLPEVDSVFIEETCQQLLSSLKQMTVVKFGDKCIDKLFMQPEARISAEINEFYRAIKG